MFALGFPCRGEVSNTPVRLRAAQDKHAALWLSGDANTMADLYVADAISLPEYQPFLRGRATIATYYRQQAMRNRLRRYEGAAFALFDLGGGAWFEAGTFAAVWSERPEEAGKYVRLWQTDSAGQFRVRAEAWGFLRPLPEPETFCEALPAGAPAQAASDPAMAQALKVLNERDAAAVRSKDAAPQVAVYADDAVLMPYAAPIVSGIANIRAYLTTYVENGRGAAFDDVKVWNTGFDTFERHVVDYSTFRVAWCAGEASGIVTGGGIRLWQRLAGGGLKRRVLIGTHYLTSNDESAAP